MSELSLHVYLIRVIGRGSTWAGFIPEHHPILWETFFILCNCCVLLIQGDYFENCHTPYVLVVMTGLKIFWINDISLYVLKINLWHNGLSWLLFGLNLWLSVMICHIKGVMFNVSCSIQILYVSNKLVSLVELTQLVQYYDST